LDQTTVGAEEKKHGTIKTPKQSIDAKGKKYAISNRLILNKSQTRQISPNTNQSKIEPKSSLNNYKSSLAVLRKHQEPNIKN